MKFKPADKSGGVVVELGPKESQLPVVSPEQAPAPLPAFKLKKILVPVDFSDCSRKALRYAIPFARQFDARLILLHVVQPYPRAPQMSTVDAELIQPATDELQTLRRTVEKEVRSETVLRVGNPHVEIIEAAEELGIDLIILSTHGRTGLAHVFLGSTAERVVRHAGCPVLIVREHEHEFVATGSTQKKAVRLAGEAVLPQSALRPPQNANPSQKGVAS